MRARAFGQTDVGCSRESNEDALLIDDELGIYAVSDGMGGHAAGEQASQLAIAAVHDYVRSARPSIRYDEPDHTILRRLATQAMGAACARVFESATTIPELSGMGCTLTLLLVAGARAVMAHAGDTRLYLHRDGATWQLSSDHTLAADLVRRGEITIGEAKKHPYASALTRALGSQKSLAAETLILDVLPDDVFLLCSDGLSNYVDDAAELSAALDSEDSSGAPRQLVEWACSKGGRDNITAVVVRIAAEGREQEEALSADVREGLEALRQVPVLRTLRFADLLRVFNLAEVENLASGDAIGNGVSELSSLRIPLSGELDVRWPGGNVTRVPARQPFGLTTLLVPRPWSGEIRARTSTRLLSIQGTAFRALARRRPWMGVRALGGLAEELQRELRDGTAGEGRPS